MTTGDDVLDPPAAVRAHLARGARRRPAGWRARSGLVLAAWTGDSAATQGRHSVKAFLRSMTTRAIALTTKVRTKRTRPAAMSRRSCSVVELGGVVGDLGREGLAAVEHRPRPREFRRRAWRRGRSPRSSRPARGPAPAWGRDDARPAEGQHGGPDHLPAGGAQCEGALLVGDRRLVEDLARQRRDDRQHHDRQDDADEEDGAAADPGGENSGNQPRTSWSPPSTGVMRLRRRQAPEAVDDGRHGGEEVDEAGRRPRASSARTG